MPKKSIMDIYLETKKKKHEIIDYEEINDLDLKKCEFCKKFYHKNGIYKHRIYCKLNPDHKTTYGNNRKWECGFCDLIFDYNKQKNLHEKRCGKNPDVIIINRKLTIQDKLQLCQKEYPEIVKILTKKQIAKLTGGTGPVKK